MPLRRHWEELPDEVRRAVERHTGPVLSAATVPTGAACDLAVTLDTATGRVFCKGGEVDGPTGWIYRNEARVNPWLPDAAPRLHWTVQLHGWLLLGFAYAEGRHPDLAPGSPDLIAVADLLGELSRELTPCPPVQVQRFADRWRGLVDPELVDGDTLLHTDMTPRNFLLGDRLRLADWSGPARGAAWVDTALMVVRLIRAGHDPAAAEAWAARVPAWADASDEALTSFTHGLVELWQDKLRRAPASHHAPLLDAAQCWHAHRRTRSQAAAPR